MVPVRGRRAVRLPRPVVDELPRDAELVQRDAVATCAALAVPALRVADFIPEEAIERRFSRLHRRHCAVAQNESGQATGGADGVQVASCYVVLHLNAILPYHTIGLT
jgi:hypothetical protein